MTYRLQSILKNSQVLPYSKGKICLQQNTPSLLLGMMSAALAFPVVVLAISFSVFLPQEKWEEFWDKFLEV